MVIGPQADGKAPRLQNVGFRVRFSGGPQKNKLKKAWILEIKFVYLIMRKKLKGYWDWVCTECGVDNRDCKCGNIQY